MPCYFQAQIDSRSRRDYEKLDADAVRSVARQTSKDIDASSSGACAAQQIVRCKTTGYSSTADAFCGSRERKRWQSYADQDAKQ